MSSEETTHRGVRWRREDAGVSFFDASSGRWVRWEPGGDAPPLPPRWGLLGVPTRITRPGWRSAWRLVPLGLVVVATAIAVFQAVAPSSNNQAKEAKASAALLGKCLARDGSRGFKSKPVPCGSAQAAVKVVKVVPTDPPTPCPDATTAVQFVFAGVAHPHLECVSPLPPSGPGG